MRKESEMSENQTPEEKEMTELEKALAQEMKEEEHEKLFPNKVSRIVSALEKANKFLRKHSMVIRISNGAYFDHDKYGKECP
jgi:glucan phosphorylase